MTTKRAPKKQQNPRAANKAQVAAFFDMSIPGVDGWIRRGCPVVARGSKSKSWEFDLLAVMKWRYRVFDSSGRPNPDKMTPAERKSWYDSEEKRRNLQVRDGELVPADDMGQAIAKALSRMSQRLLGLPDRIERKFVLDPAIVVAVSSEIESTMTAIADDLAAIQPDPEQ